MSLKKPGDLVSYADALQLPTSDPVEIAGGLSARTDIIGAFVVVLKTDGTVSLALAGADDARVMKPLIDIADVVRSHCDARRSLVGQIELSADWPKKN